MGALRSIGIGFVALAIISLVVWCVIWFALNFYVSFITLIGVALLILLCWIVGSFIREMMDDVY